MERKVGNTRLLAAVLFGLISAGAVWHRLREPLGPPGLRVRVEATIPVDGTWELFPDEGNGVRPDRSDRQPVKGSATSAPVLFVLAKDLREAKSLRLDPGDAEVDITINSIDIDGPFRSLHWTGAELAQHHGRTHNLMTLADDADALKIRCTGPDPWIILSSTDLTAITSALADSGPPLLRPLILAVLAAALVMLAGIALPDRAMRGLAGLRSHLRNVRKPSWVLLPIDLFVLLAVFGLAQRMRIRPEGVQLRLDVIAMRDDRFQLYYASQTGSFAAERMYTVPVRRTPFPQRVTFVLPADTIPRFLRLDPGEKQDSVVILSAAFTMGGARDELSLQDLLSAFGRSHDITSIALANGGITLHCSGSDPFVPLDQDLRDRMLAVRDRDKPLLVPLLAAMAFMLLLHAGLSRSRPFINAVQSALPRDIALATTFLCMMGLPLLTCMYPGIEPTRTFTEKRVLSRMPPLELRSLGEFPGLYDTWFRDHFGFRDALYRWNSWTHVTLSGTSPLPDRLIVGKDGWFFQYNSQVDADYRGLPLFTLEQLESIRKKYEERQRWLARLGIRYYIVVPPLSGTFNSEHLPDRFHRVSHLTWLDQVKTHFDKYSTVPIIDLRKDLEEGKMQREVYFRTDIHWNPFGAYFGYRRIVTRIAQDVPAIGQPCPLTDLQFVNDTNNNGDLAQMLGLNDVLTRVEPVATPLRPRRSTLALFPDLPGDFYFLDKPQTFTLPDSTKPRLLMFHDSFGLYLKPLLNEHFSKATYVWTGLFIPDVVMAEKPDIVVQEFMEMFIVNMPKDTLHLARPASPPG